MNSFLEGLFQIASFLLTISLKATLVAVLILVVRLIFRNRLPARWQYTLWFLLVIRLIIPFEVASPTSLYNLTDEVNYHTVFPPQSNYRNIPIQKEVPQPSEPTQSASITSEQTTKSIQPPLSKDFTLADMAGLVWLTVAILILMVAIVTNIHQWQKFRKAEKFDNNRLKNILEWCKKRLNISRDISIYSVECIQSPFWYGLLRPRIYIPNNLLKKFSDAQLEYLILHELAHYKRKDIPIALLCFFLQVLHWFNPVIWYSFYKMRGDREAACDEMVLTTLGEAHSEDYGQTLISLLKNANTIRLLPIHMGLVEGRENLVRRVTMIANFTRKSRWWAFIALALFLVILAVTFTSAEKAPPDTIEKAQVEEENESTPNTTIQRVWQGFDVDITGEPSPDGKYISFVDWVTGDLALYEIATGEKRHLTNKGSWEKSGAFALFSRWSPDGTQIVYDWYNDQGFIDLYTIGIEGSKPRLLYSNAELTWAQTYDWSPDGKHILACFKKKDTPNQIVLVSTADGSTRVLKTVYKDYPHNMSFSPDGHYIVYDFIQQEDSREHDISLISTDGSSDISLVRHPANDFVLSWSPDGKNILFASDRTGSVETWLISVADGKPLGDPQPVMTNFSKFRPMGFTRNGTFFYGLGTQTYFDIYIAQLNTKTGRILDPPEKFVNRFEGYNRAPDYSPDGKYLAYVSNRVSPPPYEKRPTFLCIFSPETGIEREFYPKLRTIDIPRWSPDGKSILVGGEDDNEQWGVYQINVQTGVTTIIVPPHENNEDVIYTHEWSKNGKDIFLVRHSQNNDLSQILFRDIETGIEKELYRGSKKDRFYLSNSPDGKWLAFLSSQEKVIRIIPTTGGEPRELYRGEQGDDFIWQGRSLRWTYDGKYLLFAMEEKGQRKKNIWKISIEGGEPQKLGSETEKNIVELTVHPDGQHFAFYGATRVPGEIWKMENFLSK